MNMVATQSIARGRRGVAIDERVAQIEANGAITFMHTDRQSSVVAISDSTGNVSASNRRAYGTYGETNPAQMTGTGSHPFGYTGRRWDPDLNLYYYRARWYDPTLGTFLETDPIGSLDYVNLYAYVGLEPGNGTDPTGMRNCPANDPRCVETPESAQKPGDPTPPTPEQEQMTVIVVTAQKAKKTPNSDDIPLGVNGETFYVVTPNSITKRPLRTTEVDCGNDVTVTVGRPGALQAGQAGAHTHSAAPGTDTTPSPGDNIAARISTTGAAYLMTANNAFMIRSFGNGTYATNVLSGPALSAEQTSTLQEYMRGWEGPLVNNASLSDRQRFCPK